MLDDVFHIEERNRWPLLSAAERRVAEAIAGIGYCNPFLPERVELERQALGDAFVEVGPVIWARPGVPIERLFPNVLALRERAGKLVETMRRRLEQGRPASPEELLSLRGPRPLPAL